MSGAGIQSAESAHSHPTGAALLQRAAALAAAGTRRLLGITGPPGAGKSTLAAGLVAGLCGRAALVGMDGFHLDDAVLGDLGRRDRKGAPDTFDADGYVHLLRRLRAAQDPVVYAPVFRRELETSAAGALAVPSHVPLVVTEGNYLLADGAFAPVRPLLDEVWFLEVDSGLRRERLVARHVAHGRSRRAAEQWVDASDEANAAQVEATRDRADLIVRLHGCDPSHERCGG